MERRRYLLATAGSLALHMLLMLLFIFVPQLVIIAAFSQGAQQQADAPVTVVEENPAQPRLSNATPVPVARAIARPPPRAVRPALRTAPKRELAKFVPLAPPQPPPARSPGPTLTALATTAPVATASPIPVRTQAATPAPTALPSFVAAVIAVPPSETPTFEPTAEPTVPSTAAPTTRPTLVPTERPTIAPTERPTIAPTVPPTIVPTAAPTAHPTFAPTAPPTSAPPAIAPPSQAPSTPHPSTPRPATPQPAPPATAAPVHAATTPSAAHRTGPTTGVSPRPGSAGAPVSAAPNAAAVALAPQTAPVSPRTAGSVNSRLRSLIPSDKVAYGMQSVGHADLSDMIGSVMRAFLAKVAPPPPVLARATSMVGQNHFHANSVAYVLKRLPMGLCLSWVVVAHPRTLGPPYGSQPYGGYNVGSCTGEADLPAWASALPTIPPSVPTPGPVPVLQRR